MPQSDQLKRAGGSATEVTPGPGASSPASPDAPAPDPAAPSTADPVPGPQPSGGPSATPAPDAPPAVPNNDEQVIKSGSPNAGESYTLRYSPAAGQTYKVRQDNEMSIEMPDLAAGGKGSKTSNVKQMVEQTLKFSNLKSGSFDVTTEVTNASATSADADVMVKNMIKGLNEIKGKKVTMSYDNRGRIVGGLDKAAQAGLQDLATAIGFQSLSFPEKPVKVGDTWESKVDLASALKGINPMFGAANKGVEPMPVTTKFVSVEGNIGVFNVKISGAPKLRTDSAASAVSMSFKMDINSTVRVDLKTGLMQSSQGTASTKVNMGGGPAGNISFGQTIKMNSRRV